MTNIQEEHVRSTMAFTIEVNFSIHLPKVAWDHWPTETMRRLHQKVISQQYCDGQLSEQDYTEKVQFGHETSYADTEEQRS